VKSDEDPKERAHEHGHDHAPHHDHDHEPHEAHPHDHAHVHAHSHDHELEGDPEAHRDALEQGAGAGQLLFLDLVSGIAGDMTVAALLDLGVPFRVVEETVAKLGLRGVKLARTRVSVSSVAATHFDVVVTDDQPGRAYRDIRALLERAPLDVSVRALSLSVFERLAEAESRVHGVPPESVSFHEVGAADSIVDIVAGAACLEYVGARVVASPVPLGRGSVRTAHGVLPLPAPATLECLRGIPTFDAGIDGELVTPTGAALLATVARRFERWPTMAPSRVGWGAGTKRFPDRPNALRAVLGAPLDAEHAPELCVLEANVDDMTGELVGHAIALLLAEGARDAWAVPCTMKKGRPGLVLSALVVASDAERLSALVLRETSSLGVRRAQVSRVERPRRLVDVTTRFGVLPLKVAEGPFGAPQLKPEFDACARAAAEHRVPVREVLDEVLARYRAGG
jgi:hypothetical protein